MKAVLFMLGLITVMAFSLSDDFESLMKKMKAEKAAIMKKQKDLLNERYDLSDTPSDLQMSGKRKFVQKGVRVKLPQGVTWEQLAAMKPEEIKERGLWPRGFYPLPHPNHSEGGMLFPQSH
ncbi:MAG: cytochrome B6, partial [Bacteroidia bacterium]